MPGLLDDLLQNYGPGILSNPQFMAQAQNAPQMPAGGRQAPRAPQPQPMQGSASAAPRGGGGIGNAIGGLLTNILSPQSSGRNQTIDYLVRERGLDPGAAQIVASDQTALRNVLLNPGGPETTDDIREYQFARNQGYQGSFQDFMLEGRKAGASSVTVGGGKYGTIPQGYQLVEGPEGARMEAIPGGPAAAEQEAATQAEQKRREGAVERGGLVAEEIDRALNVMDTGTLPTTSFGAFLSDVPGTGAKSLASRLDTIRANIGFEELNKMRQQSPTGGALGQVTERELAFLQSVAGSLDQAQSAEDLRYNLNRMWNSYMDVIHGPGQGPERRPLGTPSERQYLNDQYRGTGRPDNDPLGIR